MADAENNVVALDSGVDEVVKPEVGLKLGHDEALKKLADYEADAAKNAELLKKLRKFEKENKEKAEREAIEAGKFKELYESAVTKLTEVEQKIRTQAVDSALKEALTDAKAKSIPTVLKLIDRSKVEVLEDGSVDPKSVANLIKELRVSDPIFFDEASTEASQRTVVVPNLHRAGEGRGLNKEISRGEFFKLSPQAQAAKIRDGFKVIE